MRTDATADATAASLEREAAQQLAVARDLEATLHEPGQRERYRRLLAGAIEDANGALARGGEEDRLGPTVLSARFTLVQAHAAKAEDARHGAGQLSLSAQRAPTREACEDGWRRVEAIVAGAEASAAVAALHAVELEDQPVRTAVVRAARAAARRAHAAAAAARRIVDERNHAYTFHSDSSFSFGEGWYLAAAAVLAGVTIQIEPGTDGTARAEKFLHDAGLRSHCQSYRSRPRAMKQVTELVARAFRADPASAQRRLRAAFLGEEPISTAVIEWVDHRLPAADSPTRTRKKVLVWIREGLHDAERNTTFSELLEITQCVQRAGLVPVLTGDALRSGPVPDGAIDLILFWKDAVFRQLDTRRAQLQFFEYLKRAHGLVGQLGVTTAGMDGPALMGLPTLYLTDAPNVRMREWVGAVPGYQELVRESGYLADVSRVLGEWADRA